MKKIYKIEIDCPNCANKIEEKIKKIPHVNEANINFITQRMSLDVEDEYLEETIKEIIKVGKKVDSDFNVK